MQSEETLEEILEEIIVSRNPWYRLLSGDDLVALALLSAALIVALVVWRRSTGDRVSLYKLLLLSVTPVIPIMIFFVFEKFYPIDVPDSIDQAIFPLYGVLFGACILAPFASEPHRAVRMLAMTASPLLFSLLLQLFPDVEGTYFPIVLDSVSLAMGLAIFLVVVAPLRVNKRYWFYMLLVGAVTGFFVGYYLEHYFCLFRNCPSWYEYMAVVPFATAPMMFSAAVHLGREQSS